MRSNQDGFTLVEIAIVLLIIGILIGGFAMPIGQQVENKRRSDARHQIDEVKEALIGFAMAHGRLPCPAGPGAPKGEEAYANAAARLNGICQYPHGMVPHATLGLRGPMTADLLLADPWNSPLRYSVAINDANGDGQPYDFTRTAAFTRNELPALGNLVICSAASSSATQCDASDTTLAEGIPAVIYSLGKNWASPSSSADELHHSNLPAFTANTGAPAYRRPTAANRVFVSTDMRTDESNPYDDILNWVSPYILTTKMIEAGRLLP
jgi:prepilin-type N-terminal cleavage/methylation domain-containing protein